MFVKIEVKFEWFIRLTFLSTLSSTRVDKRNQNLGAIMMFITNTKLETFSKKVVTNCNYYY